MVDSRSPYKILILHALRADSRQTTIDHIYCYPRQRPGVLYAYHNINAPLSKELMTFPFDAIIINYCFLSYRTSQRYESLRNKYSYLAKSDALKIAVTQDDYTFHAVLDEWLAHIGVDTIFTPIAKDLHVLYPTCYSKAKFKPALTGYIRANEMTLLDAFARPLRERTIDVGTRVRFLPPHYGRTGILKGRLTELFRERARDAGFVADISTDMKDAFVGDDWFHFLGSCRFTLIARGGASVCDPRGELKKKVNKYLKLRPNATFDQIEAACFPGLDRYDFSAVSPRLFEAAALRTGLILIEDDYVAGLEPYQHYIPLSKDFSNIDQVFAVMRDDARIEAMIEAAYQHLVKSGQFTYAGFVQSVFGEIEALKPRSASQEQFDGLKGHYQRLGSSQRLCTEAPPHWAQVSNSAAFRAQQSGQLGALAELIAAKRREKRLRSIVAAELTSWGLLDCDVAGLAIESISGLAEDDCDGLSAFVDSVQNEHWELNTDLVWGHCEYVYDPLPSNI